MSILHSMNYISIMICSNIPWHKLEINFMTTMLFVMAIFSKACDSTSTM